MGRERRTPNDFGWTADDLRSAYAADGSGPHRYAPDGAGPFSYDPDGSGPWLVGPEPRRGAARFAPRSRRSGSRLRRLGTTVTAGALALVLAVGSVALVAHHAPPHPGGGRRQPSTARRTTPPEPERRASLDA